MQILEKNEEDGEEAAHIKALEEEIAKKQLEIK